MIVVVAARPLPSQTNVRAVPRVATGAFGNAEGWFDNSGVFVRGQHWFHGLELNPGTKITAIALRPASGRTSALQKFKLRLLLANSTLTFSRLQRNFTANLGGKGTVVFDASLDIKIPTTTDPNAGDFAPLSRPFIYAGPSFLLDASVGQGQTTNPGRWWIDIVSMMRTSSYSTTSGKSCGGNLAASYSNGSYSLSVTGAQPNGFVLLAVGLDNAAFGVIPLPLPLDGAGWTGCQLGVAPLLMIPGAADTTGALRLVLPWNGVTSPVTLFAQAFHATNRNRAGAASTKVAHTVLGRAGLFNAVQQVNNTFWAGPATSNHAGVFLLK